METFSEWLKNERKARGYHAYSDFHAALSAWCREQGREPPASRQSCASWERHGRAQTGTANMIADFFGLSDAERGRMFALMGAR